MLRRTFITTFAAIVATPAFAQVPEQAPGQTSATSPEKIISDLYAPYIVASGAAYDAFPAVNYAAMMTPELAVLYRCVSIEPDGNLPPLDWDVFVNGQDFDVTKLSVTAAPAEDGQTVTARFDNLGSEVTVFYDFVEMPEGWRINDIRYPAVEGIYAAFSLRGYALNWSTIPLSDTEPADKIRGYYERQIRHAANMTGDDVLEFTPELDAIYVKATQDAADGDIALIDWDIFVNGQDADLDHLHIMATDKDDSGAAQTVSAHFTNMGMPTTVIYDFVKLPSGWRISDVRYPDSDIFPEGWSLKAYAQSNP